MLARISKGVARLAALLLLVSFATYMMIDLIPGDPVATVVGQDATPEQYAAVRERLGLDRPLVERYVQWLGSALQGNLGDSLVPPVRQVSEVVASRLPVTLEIAVLSMVMALAIAIPVATISSYRAQGAFDKIASGGAFAMISTPNFLLALLLVFLFVFNPSMAVTALWVGGTAIALFIVYQAVNRAWKASRRGTSNQLLRRDILVAVGLGAAVLAGAAILTAILPEFPRQGFVRLGDPRGLGQNLRSAFLPALTLALTEAAVLTRVLRTDMIVTLNEDFILSARARGLPTWRILLKHALKPSSFSLFTVAGVSLGRLIGGTVIVETIFGIPGMGTMIVDAMISKDFAIVQAGVLLIAVVYVSVNAIVDLFYKVLDPRIRRVAA